MSKVKQDLEELEQELAAELEEQITQLLTNDFVFFAMLTLLRTGDPHGAILEAWLKTFDERIARSEGVFAVPYDGILNLVLDLRNHFMGR